MLHFNDRVRFHAGRTVLEYFRQLYLIPTQMNIDTERFQNEDRAYETYDGPPEAEVTSSQPSEEQSESEESSSSSSSSDEESSDGYDSASSWSEMYGSSWDSGRASDTSVEGSSSSESNHSESK